MTGWAVYSMGPFAGLEQVIKHPGTGKSFAGNTWTMTLICAHAAVRG